VHLGCLHQGTRLTSLLLTLPPSPLLLLKQMPHHWSAVLAAAG
jgi:hypothetical protein